jgi:hypothetical protein
VLPLHVMQDLLEGFLWIGSLRTHLTELADQLRLTVARNLAVARKRCQHRLVAEVLAPSFELFRRMAKPFPKLGEGSAERVRMEVGKPGFCEGLFENLPDGGGG